MSKVGEQQLENQERDREDLPGSNSKKQKIDENVWRGASPTAKDWMTDDDHKNGYRHGDGDSGKNYAKDTKNKMEQSISKFDDALNGIGTQADDKSVTDAQKRLVGRIAKYYGNAYVSDYVGHFYPGSDMSKLDREQAQKIITGLDHKVPASFKRAYDLSEKIGVPDISFEQKARIAPMMGAVIFKGQERNGGQSYMLTQIMDPSDKGTRKYEFFVGDDKTGSAFTSKIAQNAPTVKVFEHGLKEYSKILRNGVNGLRKDDSDVKFLLDNDYDWDTRSEFAAQADALGMESLTEDEQRLVNMRSEIFDYLDLVHENGEQIIGNSAEAQQRILDDVTDTLKNIEAGKNITGTMTYRFGPDKESSYIPGKDPNPYWTRDPDKRDADVKFILDNGYEKEDQDFLNEEFSLYGESALDGDDHDRKQTLLRMSDRVFDYIDQIGGKLDPENSTKIDTGRYLKIAIKPQGMDPDKHYDAYDKSMARPEPEIQTVYESVPNGNTHEFWVLDNYKPETTNVSYLSHGSYDVVSELSYEEAKEFEPARDAMAYIFQTNEGTAPQSVRELLNQGSKKPAAYLKMQSMAPTEGGDDGRDRDATDD